MEADVEDGEQVGVAERARRAGLLLEALQALGIGGEGGRQDLDRHVAPQPRVVGAVHLAHPAGTQWRHDLVRADAASRGERELGSLIRPDPTARPRAAAQARASATRSA
jgi:hypothetical protein